MLIWNFHLHAAAAAAAALIQQTYKYWQPCYVLALGQEQGAVADEFSQAARVVSLKK